METQDFTYPMWLGMILCLLPIGALVAVYWLLLKASVNRDGDLAWFAVIALVFSLAFASVAFWAPPAAWMIVGCLGVVVALFLTPFAFRKKRRG